MRSNNLLRRGIISVGALAFAASSLAGCGNSDTSGGENTGVETPGGVLNVWGAVPAESGPQDVIAAFEELLPGTKVIYTQYVNDPAGNLKLDTALQGGAKIDVFFSYFPDLLTQRANSELALDITELVSGDDVTAPLASDDVSMKFDEKLYSIPTNMAQKFTYVNKDMLDDAGIEVPTEWTVDEFHDVAKRLTNDDVHGAFRAPQLAEFALGPDSFYTTDGQANFTDPAWVADAELNEAMARDGSAFPEDQVLSQQLAAYPQNTFVNQTVGLWINDSYNFRFLNNEEEYPHEFITTFAPVPTVDGVESSWNAGKYDNWVSIASDSENPDLAWEFVKFWLSDGAQYMIPAGKVSPLESDQEKIIEGLLGENPEERYDVEAFKRVYFDENIKLGVPTQFTGLTEITSDFSTLVSQLRLGEITAAEWVTEMQSQAESAIAKSE